MSDPTPIGRVLDDLPRIGSRELISPLVGECPQHPGVEAFRCEPCGDDRDKAIARGVAFDACSERFPARYRDADITDVLDIPELMAWVKTYEADPAGAPSLLLLGGTGSGKTHAAYAAIRRAVITPTMSRAHIYRTPRWKALTHADLMASLRPRAAKDHDSEAELKTLVETDLLFIDDLGAIKATEFVEEMTYRLINGRYEAMRPNIVTSNLPLMELKDAIGDRIASRLAQDSVRVALTTPDRRRVRSAA